MVIGQDCDANGQPVFPPVGLADNQLDKIQRELLAYCQLIQPPYFPVLSLEEVEGRKLIVLWAPGGQTRPYKAPESVMAKHKVWRYYIRRYRNRQIGEFLKELEMTEGRSTGIPKILKEMAANGSPAPLFETITNFTGAIKGGELLLVGKCAERHSDVARVIEGA